MKNDQKIRVKHLFLAREKLAEDLNKPPFQVLDKHVLTDLSAKKMLTQGMLYNLINNKNISIKKRLINLLLKAQQEANTEIESKNES